ncbi:MAG: hypothetical protein ILP24_00085, partial [Paludibacteraceae bacterium]|nr:hypothetical protein [Paludibacteraceae bacterium]
CFNNLGALVSEKGRGFLSNVSDVIDNIQEICVENGAITIRLFPTKVLKYEARTLARFNAQSIIMHNGSCTFIKPQKTQTFICLPKTKLLKFIVWQTISANILRK